jgi:hypothetical protein
VVKAKEKEEEEETVEIRVGLVDSDFKKLEKGEALELASGFIGGTPIKVVIERQRAHVKTKLEWRSEGKDRFGKPLRVGRLVEDTDSAKILKIIGTAENDMKKREDIVAEAQKRHHITPLKTAGIYLVCRNSRVSNMSKTPGPC